MNIFKKYKDWIVEVVERKFNITLSDIAVEISRYEGCGDISTNAAMLLAKPLKANPIEIAKILAEEFRQQQDFTHVECANPGFINITLSKAVWGQVIIDVLSDVIKYSSSNAFAGRSVNIEFVSANPTGPMHIGHARGAIVGDIMANILKRMGYTVIKEYYINDAGMQIEALAESMFIRYKQITGDNTVQLSSKHYPGEYIIDRAHKMLQEYGPSLEYMRDEHIIREFAVASMMELIKEDLSLLGVCHDVMRSELHDITMQGKIEEGITKLTEADYTYKGVLEQPKGKVVEDWEPKEQLIFRSTDFGDDVDRPIRRSDGSNTYFAADIGYHLDKIARGFNELILVLGADHAGYVKRLKAIVKALSKGEVDIAILINQLVNLMEAGQPIKMSKRAGFFVTVSDIIREIGKDNLRFLMVYIKSDTVLNMDVAKAIEQNADNPVFYVQYAHTRAHSALSKADYEAHMPKGYSGWRSEELVIIKKIAEYPRVLESSAILREPHRLAHYLHQLATEFHALWNKGFEDPSLRLVVESGVIQEGGRNARLAIVKAVELVLKDGLAIMGIDAIYKM